MLRFIGFIIGLIFFMSSPFLFFGVLAMSMFIGAIWGFVRGFFFMIQAFITDVLGVGNL